MKLSVVIVNYNVRYYLEQCLYSVLSSVNKAETEIFVVDNNSSDGSVEYLQPKFPDVIFITNKDNLGFSKANNQAIEQAKGKYILLLNPDTIVGEHTIFNACSFMDKTPDAGGVGVKMIDGYGRFLPESKRGFPSPWNSFCKMSGLSCLFPHSPLFARYHLRYLNEDEIHKVDVLSGAFMLLRKEALDKVGLLDEAFFMYGEDIDLSYRIMLEGYCNYYLPESIIHYKGESTKKDIRYVKIFYDAMLIFFKKHYPHYKRLYSYIIYFAVYFRGGLSAIDKLLFGKKREKDEFSGNYLILAAKEISEKIQVQLEQEKECGQRIVFESGLEKLTMPLLKKNKIKNVFFSMNESMYEEIICFMNHCKNKKIRFWIYHPGSGFVIASNEILFLSKK